MQVGSLGGPGAPPGKGGKYTGLQGNNVYRPTRIGNTPAASIPWKGSNGSGQLLPKPSTAVHRGFHLNASDAARHKVRRPRVAHQFGVRSRLLLRLGAALHSWVQLDQSGQLR